MATASYPNIDACNPIECISSKVQRIHRVTATIFRKHLKPFGVSNSQLSVLFVLSKRKKMTQQQFSDFTFSEKSTVSRNLQRLFDKELIMLEEAQFIQLTKKGLTLLEEIIPAWDRAMEEVGALLDHDGVNALNLVLNKITKTTHT